jgi:hypothetical protein
VDILLAMDVERKGSLSALKQQLSRSENKKSPAKGAWIDVGSNTAGTEMLLAQIDVVIGICESASGQALGKLWKTIFGMRRNGTPRRCGAPGDYRSAFRI